MKFYVSGFTHYLLIVCFALFAGQILQAQITITSGTLPAGSVNTPYSFTFTGSSIAVCSESATVYFEPGTPYDLPDWLLLDSNSTLSGTPPAGAQTYTFHVTADDTCGNTLANQQFSINVISPSETFYVLNADGSPGTPFSIVAVKQGNMTANVTCAWTNSTDPCYNYNPYLQDVYPSTGSDFTVDGQNNFIVPAITAVLRFPPGSTYPSNSPHPPIVASVSSLNSTVCGSLGPMCGVSANLTSAAVDSAGNFVVGDGGNGAVWLFPAAGGTPSLVGTFPIDIDYGADVFVRIQPGSPGAYVVATDGGSGLQIYQFTACTPSPLSCPATNTDPTGLFTSPLASTNISGFSLDGSGNYLLTIGTDGGGNVVFVPNPNPGRDTVDNFWNVPGYGFTSSDSFAGISRDPLTGNYLFIDFNFYSGYYTLYDASSGPVGNAGVGFIAQNGLLTDPTAVLVVPPVSSVVPPPVAPIPPLVITGGALPSGYAYESYSTSVSASGGEQPYTYSGTGFPTGIGINSITGAITGTTTQTGNFTITVSVTDSQPVSLSATFTLSIAAPPTVAVPGGTLTSTIVGTPVSLTLSATGGGPPYTWSLASGTLPGGLTLQTSGTLFGTPLIAGTYNFAARATDTFGGTAVGSFTMTILPKPLTTSSFTLPTGMVSITYQPVTLTASGGTAPYSCALTTGSLPAGLTLATDCVVSGTPTAPTPSGGVNITVTIADSGTPQSSGTATYTIAVVPYQPDLILSASSLSFSLAQPTSNLPQSQTVQVQSSNVNDTLGYTVSVSPSTATWLSATPSGPTTPGSFVVSLTNAALSLAASATPYTATVTATCTSGACNGSPHTVAVSLNVTNEPAQLSVLTTLLAFNTQAANPQTTTQSLGVSNTGGGSIGFATVGCGASWCTVSGVPGSIGAGASAQLAVTANPAGLNPGYYFTDVSIVSSGGRANVPVTLFIASNGTISLGPAGAQFTLPQGGAAEGNTSFLVSVAGTQPASFNAAVSPSVPWLSVTQSSATASGTQPATVNLVFDQTQVAALTAGAYYATVEVTSSASANSPQSFEVVLNVTPPTQQTTPNPVPGGLIYLTQATLTPPAQTIDVYTGSTSAVGYQASATTNSGGNWLTVSPLIGSTSAGTAGQSTVTANPSGLKPGVYTGYVSYQFSATAVRSVNVTMVVENVNSTPSPSAVSALRPADAAACTASQIVPTSTALVSNFAAPAAWPIELAVNLVDDCGTPLNNGQVVATFSNGDPPLILSLTDLTGDFVGTWTPQHANNQITVNAVATAPGLPNATLQLAGAVTANNAPILANLAIANFYNPIGGAPLAPGALVQITGQYLAGQTLNASAVPLPTSLGGTSVIIGGLEAPLSMVSPGQLNAQVPFELPAGQPYQVIVIANNALTTPQSFQAGAASPGLSVLPSGYVQANHQSGVAVTDATPAQPGEYISVYLVGMGATTIPVGSGQPGPGAPYATTVIGPVITLNNESVSYNFSGLIPGLVGVYQVNLQIPSDAPNGDLTLTFSENGFTSNSGLLPVQ